MKGTAARIVKGAVFSFVATLTKWLRAIVVSIVIARMLGPEQYGVYTLVVWVMLVAGMFVNLGFTTTTSKYLSEFKGKNAEDHVVGTVNFVLKLEIILGLIVTAVVMATSPYLAGLFSQGEYKHLFLIAAIGIFPTAIFDICSYVFIGLQQFKSLALATFATSMLAVVLIPVALMLGFGLTGLIIINLLVAFIGLIYVLFLLKKEVPLKAFVQAKLKSDVAAKITKYNIYILGIIFFDFVVNQRTEIFFLGYFRTPQEVAYYSVAFGLASAAMTILPGSLTNVLMPIMSEAYGKNDESKLKKLFLESTRYLMILAVPITIGGIALAAPIMNVVYGLDYAQAIPALMCLFIPACAMSIGTGGSSLQYGIERQGFILKLGIVLAVINIVLDLCLIPRYGVMGAVLANSAAQITGITISQIFTCKLLKVRWPAIHFVKVVIASAAMIPFILLAKFVLGDILSLMFGFIAGIVAYAVSVILIKAVNREDVTAMEQLAYNLPAGLQNGYRLFLEKIGSYVDR